jgi:phosphoribosylglycinamide formyltransferase-1
VIDGPEPVRIGVLVSGNGTNLQTILDACRAGRIPGQVVVVISNKPDAFALARAQRAGVAAVVIDHRAYEDKRAFEAVLVETLASHQVDLVCLAGFLRILSPWFIGRFPGRIMNIHPALLPAFGGAGMYGERVHQAVIASGARFSGCTVHFADETPDGGPIILQTVVPVLDDDTPTTLARRVAEQEHHLYPEAVRLFAEGRLRVVGNRTRILEESNQLAMTRVGDGDAHGR